MTETQTAPRPRYLTTAEMAKVVRQVLKEAFPVAEYGVKFSVRSSNYAGGSSIRIAYDSDKLYSRDVNAKVKHLQSASFDGMIDLKTNHDVTLPSGEVVYGGADWISADNQNWAWEDAERQRRREAHLRAL